LKPGRCADRQAARQQASLCDRFPCERFRIRRTGLGQQFLAEIHPVEAEKGPVTTVTAKPITTAVLPENRRYTDLNVRFTPQLAGNQALFSSAFAAETSATNRWQSQSRQPL